MERCIRVGAGRHVFQKEVVRLVAAGTADLSHRILAMLSDMMAELVTITKRSTPRSRLWPRQMPTCGAFPDAMVQTCIVHLVRHSLNFCSWKDRKAVAADPRRIYSAPNSDLTEAELDAFEEKWARKYASIAPAW